MPQIHDGDLTPQMTTDMLVAVWLALFERKHPTGDAIASAPMITFNAREEQLYLDLTEELRRRTNADRERMRDYSKQPSTFKEAPPDALDKLTVAQEELALVPEGWSHVSFTEELKEGDYYFENGRHRWLRIGSIEPGLYSDSSTRVIRREGK